MATHNGDEDKKEKTPEGIRIHDIKHDVRPSFQCDDLQVERDRRIQCSGSVNITVTTLVTNESHG